MRLAVAEGGVSSVFQGLSASILRQVSPRSSFLADSVICSHQGMAAQQLEQMTCTSCVLFLDFSAGHTDR